MTQLVVEAHEHIRELALSEKSAAWRRVVLGRFLLKAKAQLPIRGTPTHGWMAFLEAIEMDDTTATRYIKLAEATLTLTESNSDQVPTYGELGLDRREGPLPQFDIPSPTDDDIAPRVTDDDPAPSIDIDRDTWCTPSWITEAIGTWDLDPCSNERSEVKSTRTFLLDRGEDGLELAAGVKKAERVYINPPYSDVTPWIEAYKHTRFCFLLKFDPSTKWFELLMKHTGLVLFPRGTRVEFKAPPGVPTSGSNPFPHALFFARRELAAKAIKKLCHVPWMPR